MSDDRSPSSYSPVRWVAIPVLITLAVTVLRVVGERNHWNPRLFSTEPGGQFALIGIMRSALGGRNERSNTSPAAGRLLRS